MRRYLEKAIKSDLGSKLILISGPRQAGKTTMARQIAQDMAGNKAVYLNWDYPEHRKAIRSLDWPRSAPVIVLDEIHKYPDWKSLLKGFYDVEGPRQAVIVTGSARLNVYRRGGDSLLGRAYHYRLHPFTTGEILREGNPPRPEELGGPGNWGYGSAIMAEEIVHKLLAQTGFPEPYTKAEDKFLRRWRLSRRERILYEDLRDLTLVRNVTKMEYLLGFLAERVGAPLSINALREDLQVDHKTIESWLDILERLYLVFQVKPYARKLQRALRKAKKVYFWDWSEIPDQGPRFENLVAAHLLKLCHYLEDVEGLRVDLRYVRDTSKREVDFLLLKDQQPWVLIEAKTHQTRASSSLSYFAKRLQVDHAFQVTLKRYRGEKVVPSYDFLSKLP